jgi:hypothetical protein
MKCSENTVGALILLITALCSCSTYELPGEKLTDVWPGDSVLIIKRQMQIVSNLLTEVTNRGHLDAEQVGYFYSDALYFRTCRNSNSTGYLASDSCNYDVLLSRSEKMAFRASIDSLKLLGVHVCDYSSIFHVHLFLLERDYQDPDDYRYVCLSEQLDTADFKKSIFEVMDRQQGVFFLRENLR